MRRSIWVATVLLGVCAFGAGLLEDACAQRISFPSPDDSNAAVASQPLENSPQQGGPYGPPFASSGQAGPTTGGAITGGGTSGSYGSGAQVTVPPNATPYAPPPIPGGPAVPPTWDPFATPGAQPPPTLLPQDPALGAFPPPQFDTLTQMRRFLQQIRADYVWIAGDSGNELGLNEVDLSAKFAIPVFKNLDRPLFITPGFAFQFWNGPKAPGVHLPPQTYEAYLDAAWDPQLSPILGSELNVRIGVYSDFSKVDERSLRLQGKGLAVVSLSPSMKLKAGVWYLDRNKVKLLPAGGLLWTPNADVNFAITFPDPRLAIRLPGYSTVEWWLYFRGEYGGDCWTAEVFPGLEPYEVDYNDIRIALGVEFKTVRELEGLIEVGGAFDRELVFRPPLGAPDVDTFRPNAAVFLRACLAY